MAKRIFPISTGKSTWGDVVAPRWNVQKQESASGLVRAIVEQDLPTYERTLKFPMITKADMNSILGFFNLCKGELLPFYIKNINDCHVENQTLGRRTDGTYQLVKVHGDYVEPVDYVENLKIYVNGTQTTNYTETDGRIALTTSGTVTASYDYYEKVRFGGNISFTEIFDNVWSCSVKVVTAK